MKRIVIDGSIPEPVLIEALSITIDLMREKIYVTDLNKKRHTFPIKSTVIKGQDDFISIYGYIEDTPKYRTRAEELLDEAAKKDKFKLVQ